ncbi:ankyrin repeat domain-containing protein [Streptomyces sp. NBC_01451]|uniref:ankyrin repeat domain-containing protein n=1 Tax=Streptomyces sp. NBC_01451 TaxID=2903872 RepID=UPI002E32E41C|nr:ankyrin repeat domain-containing protein [Streptomyces sp. NBC_01451]
MADERVARWNGVTRRSMFKDHIDQLRDRLADAARDGDWRTVFEILDKDDEWTNSARLEGGSGYAPLHQAAWHGVPVATVERLLSYGAWRTLRASDGTRPVDIAARLGHHHLAAVLRPEFKHPLPQDELARLQENFHRLIRYRSGGELGDQDLATEKELRLPEIEVLTELDNPVGWFPVPGMYGGFKFELRGRELIVDSWVRIVGGSERTGRVTAEGVFLVHEGKQI